MSKKTVVRIIIDFVIFLAVIQGWWFVALPIGLAAVLNLPYYAEIVIAGIFYDSLFGLMPGSGIDGYLASIVTLTAYIILTGLKKVVRD